MKAQETAVIFIEFQNDFCSPGGKLYDQVADQIAKTGTVRNASRLLALAREKGCKIIHCPFTLDREWVAEIKSGGTLAAGAEAGLFAPESWGHDIIDELAPLEGEVVLAGKRALSAFSHTNLAHLLHFAGIKNLVVAGFLTNVCAQATAMSAYDAGYSVRMVPEACGAVNQTIQDYVEKDFAPLLGGCMTVDEFDREVQ
ncbi:MAG: cysteine hydrolase [Planctomycetia bacterium]|nr:cysteine hydrolase [Planctomycetia bacterium]